jgi:hypothetical protein
MRQPVVWITTSITVGVIALVIIGLLGMPKSVHKTFPADTGPNFIDVSSYPVEMQQHYKLFESKCSRCHTLARPINSKLVGEEWRKYVHKMMRKPGSGLIPKTANKIVAFLIYDSQVRKKQD